MTTQTMKDFFNRADVRELQDIQKRHKYGSKEHREAFERLKKLAAEIGAEKHFGEY